MKTITPKQKSTNRRKVQNLSPTARYRRNGIWIPINTDAGNYDHLTEEEKEIEKKRNHELKMATEKKNAEKKRKAVMKRSKNK